MESKTAQLRAKPNVISQYGSGPFWETPSRAKFLIETGQFYLVNAPGPVEQPAVGPTETKPAAPAEKKYTSNANEAAARGRDIMSGTILRELAPGDMGYVEKKSSDVAPAGPSIDSASSSEPGAAAQSSASEADHHSPLTNADLSPRRGRGRPPKSGSSR